MSKRKGMSLEDKRKTILNIYHTNKEVYNLKEMEGLASKRGVVLQSIKEVNQSLCDDSLVDSDKIGAANFFWSFPSKALIKARNLKEDAIKLNQNLKETVSALEIEINTKRRGKESTTEREQMLKKLADEKEKLRSLEKEMQIYKDNDPEEIEKMEKENQSILESVNRWTDNIFAIKSYLVKKRGMLSKDVDRLLEIKDDFDYVEG